MQPRFVLVNTSHPGNIGATARALKNMALDQLYLVTPARFPDVEATARASGAHDLLANAVVTDNLTDALTGCSLVMGCSARPRTLSLPTLTPKQAAEKALKHHQANQGDIAILFGNEQSGLDNNQINCCHYQIHIPSNPDYSSLNLAAAVQIISYEIHCHQETPTSIQPTEPLTKAEMPATAEEMAGFYDHLQETLKAIQFLNPKHSQKMISRLHRLFNRAKPNHTEINILRGILTAINKPKNTN